MVSKKRLYSGFVGYRAPVIPRAPRSIRKRGPHKKSVEDGQLCAFELLAAVAGKLLLESESSASSSVAEGNSQIKNDKALKSESFNHGSFAESASLPNSDFLEKIDCDIKPGMREEKSSDENATCKIGSSNCVGESFNSKVESGPELQSDDGKNKIGHFRADISTVNDGQYVNTNGVTNPEAESSVKFPLYRESTHNNVKLGIRDDDENSFRCNKSSTKSRSQPRIIRHRMRKMMASKYRRATTRPMNYELYNTSEGMKSFFRYRKNTTYARERCERGPLKKRKLSDHNSFGAAFESSDSISNSPKDGLRGEMNSSVTFSIKSFKVPELYIEVPEAATVGSLKRTVMDAVAAIIGGGIRVGVVFQGKKVRDDHRTLQQAGISQCANLDNVGFILEPSFAHVSPSKPSDKLPALSLCDADEPFPRSSIYPMTHSEISNASIDPQPPVIKSDKVETNEFKSTPDNMLTDGAVIDSKALIPVSPPLNVEALAVVPLNSKPKRGDLSQRRTRRPFSVGEVEALVESVEKLGTGRWRDVKIRAFENADHRTYVDLKDKWKTLVHTASIAPQQRRGEPVPQELLDRVLSAHSYWLQHQSKQQGKHPAEPLKMVGCSEEIMGA